MSAEDVAVYLDANVAGLTLGTNLFIGRMPDAPDAAVAVGEPPGSPPTMHMGNNPVPIEQPQIQIRVRAASADTSYSAARTTIRACYNALKTASGTINGTRYLGFGPRQDPFPLGADDWEREEWSVNFDVWRESS